MDVFDQGQEQAQKQLDMALALARGKSKPARTAAELPTECINGCGEKPAEGALYCCNDCRLDFEDRHAKLRKQGFRG